MSGNDDFLARWSRRKQDAKADARATPPAADDNQNKQEPAQQSQADASSQQRVEAEPEFDLSSLPSIESITSVTDVSVFLRKGVPAELARAALRRAWAADPAIREFIGLSENAWDFTKPGAVPGFGPLETTDDVARMVSEVMKRTSRMAEVMDQAASGEHVDDTTGIEAVGTPPPAVQHAAQPAAEAVRDNPVPSQDDGNGAPCQNTAGELGPVPPKRRHGGALPP
jgi:hypothetical protein